MATLRRKLVIVGNGACGKTSLLIVFSHGTFPVEYVPTVFKNYVTNIDVDGKRIELALSRILTPTPDSLDNVQEKWISEVLHFCPKLPIMLVGCKADLRQDLRVVEQLHKAGQRPMSTEQGKDVAQRIGAHIYRECSAKSGEGVKEVFRDAPATALKPIKKPHRPICIIL
ncbi:protein rho1 [Mycena maculata]|uniref:Protein rho1 n=1 Tax=Mycena maculata TaxID=230809 RepID=A0AAD7MY11_9AGAR|nr:protein rho1 [Mycena maculata]